MFSQIYRENGAKKKLGIDELQLRIAKYIINNEISSPFDVEDGLKISKVLANNTFTKMKKKGYLDKIKTSNRKTYYSLSKDGIRWILDKGQLTSEQFWKHLSNSKYSKQEIKELCNLYENKILGVDKTRIIPQMFLNKINNEELKIIEVELDDKIIFSILKTISKYKPMKSLQLIHKLKSNNIHMTYLLSLVDQGLVTKTNDTYYLTYKGLFELFFCIYRDTDIGLQRSQWDWLDDGIFGKPLSTKCQDFVKSNNPQAKKIIKKLDKLRERYEHLLPEIFNDENIQKLGISFFEVVLLLMKLYKSKSNTIPRFKIYTYEITNQYFKEFQKLEKLNKTRQEFYDDEMLDYLYISYKIRDSITSNSNARKIYDITSTIVNGGDSVLEGDVNGLSEGLSEGELWKKSFWYNGIKKKITFDFYCIYKAYCDGWNDKLLDSKIKQWHDQEIRTLLDFSKNYIIKIELSL